MTRGVSGVAPVPSAEPSPAPARRWNFRDGAAYPHPPRGSRPATPDPFNPQAHLPYELGEDGGDTPVTPRLVDPRGRVVRTLVDGDEPRGRFLEAAWRGRDAAGRAAPGGTDLARLVVDGRSQARLISLVR